MYTVLSISATRHMNTPRLIPTQNICADLFRDLSSLKNPNKKFKHVIIDDGIAGERRGRILRFIHFYVMDLRRQPKSEESFALSPKNNGSP